MTRTIKHTRKRDDLIQVGRDIVVRQGFNATGLSNILATAGVPKGSFYYYFESKEDFGLAIIEDFVSEYQQKLATSLGNQELSPLARLSRYFELGIADMETSDCASGCLIGNLAQEMSAQNELFRDRLNQVLTAWETQFADCIEDAYAAGELAGELAESCNALDLAKFILAGWQGAMLRAKVTQSTEPLYTFIRILFEQILHQPVPARSTAG
ncbi:MAG: TetR family transcriptional regulator C-terminal domain-containing protein [Phormidesmis sp.]